MYNPSCENIPGVRRRVEKLPSDINRLMELISMYRHMEYTAKNGLSQTQELSCWAAQELLEYKIKEGKGMMITLQDCEGCQNSGMRGNSEECEQCARAFSDHYKASSKGKSLF